MTVTRANNKHLVVIGFGFANPRERDAKVASQVEKYLDDARSGDYTQTAMIPMPGKKGSPLPDDGVRVASTDPVMPMAAPAFRLIDAEADPTDQAPADPQSGVGDVDEDLTTAVAVAPAPVPAPMPLPMPDTVAVDAAASLAHAKDELRRKLPPVVNAYADQGRGGAPAPLGQTRPSAPLIPPVGIDNDGQPIDLLTSGSVSGDVQVAEIVPAAIETPKAAPAPAVEQPMPAALPQGWVVQLGAAPTEDGANGLIQNASGKVRSLAKLNGYVQRFDKDGQTFFRARFSGFSGQSAANDMCKQLKQAKMSCLAMQG